MIDRAAARKSGDSFDRVTPIESTLALVPTLRQRYGITRVAELTHLDRIGIPVVASIVPRSRDLITVYNGKGRTRDEALVGSVMEAVERQVAGAVDLTSIEAIPGALPGALDPVVFDLDAAPCDRPIAYVPGHDVLSGGTTYVPLAAVEWPPAESVFARSSTNGLAAGNTLLEATYHALFELVERHVWAVTHARAHLRPHALFASFVRGAEGSFDAAMTDDAAGIAITLPTGNATIDEMLERIARAGVTTRLRLIGEDPLPRTVVATLHEPGATRPTVHVGLGCSWSTEHATIRALTEAAQSRLTDIAGAREDIVRPNRLPHGRWHFDGPATSSARLRDIADLASRDLAVDVERLLAALRTLGLRHAVVVDLSPAECGVHVVRVLVPGLESLPADDRRGRTIRTILGRGGKQGSGG